MSIGLKSKLGYCSAQIRTYIVSIADHCFWASAPESSMCSRLIHAGSDMARTTFDTHDERLTIVQGSVEGTCLFAERGDVRRSHLPTCGEPSIVDIATEPTIVVRDASKPSIRATGGLSFVGGGPESTNVDAAPSSHFDSASPVCMMQDPSLILASTGAPA